MCIEFYKIIMMVLQVVINQTMANAYPVFLLLQL